MKLPRRHQLAEGLDLDGRVTDHLGHELVIPHILLPGRHIEVSGHHQGRGGVAPGHERRQPLEEIQLVVELGVDRPIRLVAARGDVEVLHFHAGDHAADHAGVSFTADIQRRRRLNRQTRGDGDAVPALLPGDPDVGQAHVHKGLSGKFGLAAFDFLQAQHVRRLLRDEAGRLFCAQADGIDVPGADSKAHGALKAQNPPTSMHVPPALKQRAGASVRASKNTLKQRA